MLLLENFHKLTLDLENIGKLKGLILQLAVRGRLSVEWRKRNGQAELADELLERVKVEKKKLVKAYRLKADKDFPAIAEDEIPFELPEGWAWTRLGEICLKIGSGSTPRGGKDAYKSEGIKFIRSQNVYNEGLVFNNLAYIDEGTHRKMAGTKVFPNDILLNITGGSIGRCALVPKDFDEANVSQHVTIIRTVPILETEFIHQLFMSPYFQDYIMATQTGGSREGLAKKNMELMLIPVPPLSEQREIIEIVKQAFEKVYQLQKLAKESDILKEQFVGSALNKLTTNTLLGWPIIKENFTTFFKDQRSISKLKESILQLAVQGKLTPQVETDEPATELLKRIKEIKGITNGKRTKDYELLPVVAEEMSFQIPKSWAWCRVGEITECLDHIRKPIKKELRGEGEIPYYGANGQVGWIDDYLFDEDLVLVVEDETFEGRTKPFSYIVRGKTWVNNHAHVLRPAGGISVEFLNLLLCKYDFVPLTSGTTGRKKLTKQGLLTAPIAIPPLAEQERIIFKVGQVMKHIDQLEQQVISSQAQAQQLLQAVLKEAFGKNPNVYEIEENVISQAAEA